MRTFTVSVGSILLLLFLNGKGRAQFEGIVESKNLTTDEMGEEQHFVMTMWIMKDMIKIQTSASGTQPGTTMIYRNDKRVVLMLNDDDRTYFEIRKNDDDEGQHLPPAMDEKYSVKRTGKTKNFLGYPSEQLIIKRGDEETEIWGTKKLGHVMKTISKALGEEGSQTGDDWSNEITKMGIYPLTSSTKLEGRVVESQEVTKIEAKSLPLSVFEIPVGYKKRTITDMLDELPREEKK